MMNTTETAPLLFGGIILLSEGLIPSEQLEMKEKCLIDSVEMFDYGMYTNINHHH